MGKMKEGRNFRPLHFFAQCPPKALKLFFTFFLLLI